MKKLLFFITFSFALSYILVKDVPLLADEIIYYPIIETVTSLSFTPTILSITSSLPGYVISIGLIKYLFNLSSVSETRFITTLLSLMTVYIVFLTMKEISPINFRVKILQFVFLPILFVFFFLIYTDAYSLLFISLSFLLTLKKRFMLAGIAGFLSLLIRQNNLIWLTLLCCYIFSERNTLNTINLKSLIDYLKEIHFFLFSFVLSLIFIIINKGIVISETNKLAQPLSIHFDNIYFLLFLFFFLFFSLNFDNLS